MQNKYPLWKNILLIVVAILGILYALPNLYGDDPAVQISVAEHKLSVDANLENKIQKILAGNQITYKSLEQEDKNILIRFANTDNQLKAKDLLSADLGEDYTVASSLAPATPHWLTVLKARPMKYGLDLRGGVHFLLKVDVDGVIDRRENGLVKTLSQELRQKRIRYASIDLYSDKGILLRFRDINDKDNAANLIRENHTQLMIDDSVNLGDGALLLKFTPSALHEIQQYTVEQTMTVLRNRVNELGVEEPMVQQQGADRIAVDLPGLQDASRAQQILGGTATVELHMVDVENDARTAYATGIVPVGTKLYMANERPVLLKNEVILTGDSITNAMMTYDDTGLPAVSISLGGGGESLFTETTRKNIGKPMSIVYVETKVEPKKPGDKSEPVSRKVEKVIMVATIQDVLISNFRITGISDQQEATNLALLLRAGALPATIYPVESRLIGPTLGKENIQKGVTSLAIGMLIIILVMAMYYRLFGLIADVGLILNLILLVAILSLIGAVLTLPGIAGIVLTVGMAVDANILIYERIREERRHGASIQAAIYAGYERAFATIVDANVTTLIVAVILFAIGSGAVKGFAITLMIGLMTSMITGIAYTRGIVNAIYGGRSVERLSIGA